MAKKRVGLRTFADLKDYSPWTMGLAGITRLMTWETETVLGISKTSFRKRIIQDVLEILQSDSKKYSEIDSILSCKYSDEIDESNAIEIYEKPTKSKLISPFEAQRRVRYFSEEFLNKEFDVFMSLLPNQILSEYMSSFFHIDTSSKWNIIGSSNDFEQSTEMSFMYMDTLAYSDCTKTLIALELKLDSNLGDHQILKYMFMKAYLEDKGMIARDSNFHILVLGAASELHKSPYLLLQEAKNQLERAEYPKKRVTKEEMELLSADVKRLLENTSVKYTSWQEFGTYFKKIAESIEGENNSETLFKLINGFLDTLSSKYSRKLKSTIFKAT